MVLKQGGKVIETGLWLITITTINREADEGQFN